MACASTGNCSSCAGANCSGGCEGTCNGCSGCGGACSSGCGGGCGNGCTGTCLGNCSGGCSSGCQSSCSGCSGSCDGCSGCGSGCASTCTGGCKTACNSTCSGKTQDTNIAKLTLDAIMKQKDITNIATAIKFEVVNRRGKTLSNTLSFAVGELIDDGKITKLIANLEQTGQLTDYTAKAGSEALKALATDIIAKIKAANKVTIKVS